jgi:hypothetical protein
MTTMMATTTTMMMMMTMITTATGRALRKYDAQRLPQHRAAEHDLVSGVELAMTALAQTSILQSGDDDALAGYTVPHGASGIGSTATGLRSSPEATAVADADVSRRRGMAAIARASAVSSSSRKRT